jgi:hypothetical protein
MNRISVSAECRLVLFLVAESIEPDQESMPEIFVWTDIANAEAGIEENRSSLPWFFAVDVAGENVDGLNSDQMCGAIAKICHHLRVETVRCSVPGGNDLLG